MNPPALQPNPLPEDETLTPAARAKGVRTEVLCVRFNADRVRPILSVQREFNLTSGIRRGVRDDAGRLMLDHSVAPDGRLLFGGEMRRGTISVWEHQIRALSEGALGSRWVLAVVGDGNLTQNPYFVAWFRRGGEFVRLANEPVVDSDYDCLVVRDGRCAIKRLRFEPTGFRSDVAGWRALDAQDGTELDGSVDVVFSGQRIVKSGSAIGREELEQQILAGLYYDLRHVLRFPAIKSGAYWKDLGLDQFYDNGSIDRDALAAALAGQGVTIRWRDYTGDVGDVRTALDDKGYRPGGQSAGTYTLDGNTLTIVYSDAIYCHNVLGVDSQGNPVTLQITGWSNNAGATLEGACRLAATVCQDAILLDNGGDVFFFLNSSATSRVIPFDDVGAGPLSAVVKSCEKRYLVRATVLFTTASAPQDKDFENVPLPTLQPSHHGE